jgi:short-subunit dehydrogenase
MSLLRQLGVIQPQDCTARVSEPPLPASSRGRHRVVIITGGSSGIGRCTAALFARRGCTVGLIARGQAGLTEAAEEVRRHGGKVSIAVADVACADALASAAAVLIAELGIPDIWINCAGNGVYGQFSAVPHQEFDRVTAVTYTGTVNGCRTALSVMGQRGYGTIVNVCSAAAFHGLPMMSSYAGAKAAIRAFAQALRAELRIAGSLVRVTTVFPPAVNTPFFSHAISHAKWPARPAPPVYQPEVIAAGLYYAATKGGAEVASLFGLVVRVAPDLIAWCMTRLGFESQLSRDPEAGRLMSPTLFAPSGSASPVHGPFGRYARRRSFQLAAKQALSTFTRDRTEPPTPPRHVEPEICPAPAHSA